MLSPFPYAAIPLPARQPERTPSRCRPRSAQYPDVRRPLGSLTHDAQPNMLISLDLTNSGRIRRHCPESATRVPLFCRLTSTRVASACLVNVGQCAPQDEQHLQLLLWRRGRPSPARVKLVTNAGLARNLFNVVSIAPGKSSCSNRERKLSSNSPDIPVALVIPRINGIVSCACARSPQPASFPVAACRFRNVNPELILSTQAPCHQVPLLRTQPSPRLGQPDG